MESAPTVRFCRLRPEEDADLPLPRYMTPLAAGMDLCAAVSQPLTLAPGASGLAAQHGIGLIKSPGTIDADYRGEVQIPLINLGKTPFTVRRGDRIAQMVINRICQVQVQLATRLEDTVRSTGGFGHTGV